jgi:secreted trypsin-like serine protease
MSCNCNKNKKQPTVKSKDANIKVVNGITVNYQKYPFFGVLWKNNSVICGSSLIKKGDESIVITAAHCVDFATASELQVGFYQPNRITKKYIYNVTKIQIHPGWNRETFENDIALLTISGTPPSEVPVLAIPSKVLGKKFIIPGTKTKVIGYGDTKQGEEQAFLLQCGCSPIISKNNPKLLWDDDVKNIKDIIFAGQSFSNPTQNVNACVGDSGGPLLYVYNGVTYLVGLTSFVSLNGCSAYGYPAGYTNVNYYRDWITKNAGV